MEETSSLFPCNGSLVAFAVMPEDNERNSDQMVCTVKKSINGVEVNEWVKNRNLVPYFLTSQSPHLKLSVFCSAESSSCPRMRALSTTGVQLVS